jgi:hypothetical protein
VPDGETTTQPPAQQPESTEPPPPPDTQIQQEISTGRVMEWLGGLFGNDEWESTAGGGGTGGQFMFASVAELNEVIAQWQAEHAAIQADGVKISQAAGYIQAPADDGMSVKHADVTMLSLDALQKHNQAMADYADGYIKKLIASRDSIVNAEQNNVDQMRSVDRS